VGSSRTIRVDVRDRGDESRSQEAVRTGLPARSLLPAERVPIDVPPLRERRADISQLVMFFLSRFSRKLGKQISAVAGDDAVSQCLRVAGKRPQSRVSVPSCCARSLSEIDQICPLKAATVEPVNRLCHPAPQSSAGRRTR
jgi:hypothetical protein